jgi:sodium-dependent dicarboxylate transporter 2/3/5
MVKVWEPQATRPVPTGIRARFHYLIISAFVAMAALVAFGLSPEGLSTEGQRVLGVFILCAGLWVTSVIPLQITSILAIILLPLLKIMPSAEAFSLFGSNAVFFILGAFILSAVLVECGLSVRIACLVLERGAFSARSLRNSILLFAAFASFWMSEHAVASMMFPIVAHIVKALGLKPLKSRFGMSFFFALAWGCVIGGIATYLGGARNPLAAGILFSETGIQISFVRWLAASFPVVAVMLIVALLVLNVIFREEETDMEAARRVFREEREKLGKLKPRETGIAILTLLTITAWVLLHNTVGLGTIALLSVALMFVFRLTNWDVIEQNVNWGIILMYGGAIALGSALHSTGASTWLVGRIFGGIRLSPLQILLLLGTTSLVLTEFISNAAVVSVMMPIALELAKVNGLPFEVVTFAVALPSGLSYTLPMGTPATAIAYSSGFMTHRDFLRIGPAMGLASLIVFSLAAKYWWPLLGY